MKCIKPNCGHEVIRSHGQEDANGDYWVEFRCPQCLHVTRGLAPARPGNTDDRDLTHLTDDGYYVGGHGLKNQLVALAPGVRRVQTPEGTLLLSDDHDRFVKELWDSGAKVELYPAEYHGLEDDESLRQRCIDKATFRIWPGSPILIATGHQLDEVAEVWQLKRYGS